MQVEIPFAEIRTLEPEEFIDVLVNVLDVKGVVVGANYRFGALPSSNHCLLPDCHERDVRRSRVVNA